MPGRRGCPRQSEKVRLKYSPKSGPSQQLGKNRDADHQNCKQFAESVALKRMEDELPNRKREKKVERNKEEQKNREQAGNRRIVKEPDQTACEHNDHLGRRSE